MRSPGSAGALRAFRRSGEAALRAALLASLAAAIYLAATSINARPDASAAGDDIALQRALRDWSTSSSPKSAVIRFDSTPSAATRAWAASLRGAGTALTWSSPLPVLGVSVEAVPDPKGKNRISISGPTGKRVAIADSLGAIDTVAIKSAGASLGPLVVHGAVHAASGKAAATAAERDSLIVKPLLVIGRAGWEAKFTVAALEEYGWKVNARLAVSPGNDVTQGLIGARIDTSSYSAVVVLDSTASRFAPAIIQYVRSGGGLIAMGEGASLGALQQIFPAHAAPPSAMSGFTSAKARDAFGLRALSSVSSDAVVLEKRGGRAAIAARRVGRGRVIQIGYDDTWRWRMAGPGDAVEDHRNWISSVVSSTAYAPSASLTAVNSDPAPTAAIYASLGEPSAGAAHRRGVDTRALLTALFIVAIGALVLETASRRLDGRA